MAERQNEDRECLRLNSEGKMLEIGAGIVVLFILVNFIAGIIWMIDSSEQKRRERDLWK